MTEGQKVIKRMLEEQHYLSKDKGKTFKRKTLEEIGKEIMDRVYGRNYRLVAKYQFIGRMCNCTTCENWEAVPFWTVDSDRCELIEDVNDPHNCYRSDWQDSGVPHQALYIQIGHEFLRNNDFHERVPRTWIGYEASEYKKLHGKKKEKANA